MDELNLLLGKPAEVDGIPIYQLTIDEICNIGEENYNRYVNILTFNVEDTNIVIENEDITTFDIISATCYYDNSFLDNVCDALHLFTKIRFIYNMEYHIFTSIDKPSVMLYGGNYERFKYCMRKQNGMRTDSEFKPADSKAKSIIKRLQEMRKKYSKHLNVDRQTLSDIISSLCAKHPSINLLNVKNMTVYQVYDQFKRVNAIDNYFIGIEQLMHGASKDEVTLKHWSQKID